MWDEIELSRHVKIGRRAPSSKDVDALHQRGARSVIDLRTDQDRFDGALSPEEEERELATRGIRYLRLPLSMAGFDAAQLDRIGAALRQAEKPVMIHCVAAKRAGMAALAETSIEAGIPGIEMLEMARNLDLVYGPPHLQHAFSEYVDERRSRPTGQERREMASRETLPGAAPLPDDLWTLRDEMHQDHHREQRLDNEAELRLPPSPGQPLTDERKSRPLSQPGASMRPDLAGTPPPFVPEPREPASLHRVRRVAVPARVSPEPAPIASLPPAHLGTPAGLAAAGAIVGLVLLMLDRRLFWPMLVAAGAIAGRAAMLSARTSPVVAAIAKAERAEDREVADLEARVERLARQA